MKKIVWLLASLMAFSALAFAADMEMQAVESSLLKKVGYDPETRTLAIQMNNSSDVYLYQDVPPSRFEALLEAESKGAYYVKNIKGKFEVTRK